MSKKYGGAREATNDTIWHIRVACSISRATRACKRTRTHKYVTLIAFLRQQLYCEHASVLRHTFLFSQTPALRLRLGIRCCAANCWHWAPRTRIYLNAKCVGTHSVCRPGAVMNAAVSSVFTPEWDSTLHTRDNSELCFLSP
jgi:hypothetical protein